jgi:ribose transport system substrate-binding protein
MDYLRHAVNRRFVLAAAASLSAATVSGFPKRSFAAAEKPLLVNSIRSLSNAYHATWNKGGEAFAKAVGCEYLTLLTEGNSEKGIADINAVLARTKGNCVINVDPNDTPDARPIIEACFAAGAHVMTQWSKPTDLHPWDRNPYWVSHVTFDGLTSGRATADELSRPLAARAAS